MGTRCGVHGQEEGGANTKAFTGERNEGIGMMVFTNETKEGLEMVFASRITE